MYYDETKPDAVVSVLGTDYSIYLNVPVDADERTRNLSGFCDKTSKRIVISKITDTNLDEPTEYGKYVIRHELIHAFLFESGISGDTTWDTGEEHPEHMVEWIGMQFPKMMKVFEELGVL